MIGYVTWRSSDGTFGGITPHGGIVRDLYSFQGYAGTPLSLEERVIFGVGANPSWPAVNVAPVLDGNGNPLFDNDGRIH